MQTTPSGGNTVARDFSTVSPSAYTLLMMKGLTPIPYARQAAQLLLAARPATASPVAISALAKSKSAEPLFQAARRPAL